MPGSPHKPDCGCTCLLQQQQQGHYCSSSWAEQAVCCCCCCCQGPQGCLTQSPWWLPRPVAAVALLWLWCKLPACAAYGVQLEACSLRRCVASLLWHLCMCYDITSAIRDPSCCTHPLALLPTPHSACDPWRAATSTITHQQQAAHITGEGQCTSVLKHRGKRRVAPCNAAVHVSHM